MRKKLFAGLAVCLVFCLAVAVGVSVHSGVTAKERLAVTRNSIACNIARRLAEFPFSYEELTAQAENEPQASVRLWTKAGFIIEEFSLFQDSYFNERTDTDIPNGVRYARDVLSGYFTAIHILEAAGPSEELEELYGQLEPYCRLLFEWEIVKTENGEAYADADVLLRRLSKLSEIDSQFQMTKLKQKLERLEEACNTD